MFSETDVRKFNMATRFNNGKMYFQITFDMAKEALLSKNRSGTG